MHTTTRSFLITSSFVTRSKKFHRFFSLPTNLTSVKVRTFFSSRLNAKLSDLPPPPQIPQRRVVVTGLGLVTPLGTGVQHTWKRLINGEVAIERILDFDVSEFPSKVAAMVKKGTGEGEFNAEKWISRETRSLVSPFIEYALAAASEALQDSKWSPRTEQDHFRTGYRKISPYFIPKILVNMAAGHISIYYGFKGPVHSASTACATGGHAIGDAYRFIQRGDADVIVCGGTEAAICPLTLAGFSRMTALSSAFNNTPQQASRPFDKKRDGFVIGEGAGILVLEELEHARNRGAKIYAEIRGYGVSGDAFHLVSPDHTGLGAQQCMRMAIRQSGLDPSLIGYINAHATSTPSGDRAEVQAIAHVFGPHAQKLAISSTKGAIGHLLGASGAVEAIFTVLALHHDLIPPTANLETPDVDYNFNFVPLKAQNKELVAAMTNSFGFGGTNCSLIFSKPPK